MGRVGLVLFITGVLLMTGCAIEGPMDPSATLENVTDALVDSNLPAGKNGLVWHTYYLGDLIIGQRYMEDPEYFKITLENIHASYFFLVYDVDPSGITPYYYDCPGSVYFARHGVTMTVELWSYQGNLLDSEERYIPWDREHYTEYWNGYIRWYECVNDFLFE